MQEETGGDVRPTEGPLPALTDSQRRAKRATLSEIRKRTKRGKERPNVVLILADDLAYADLGVHGSTEIPTPHIDGLARSGLRFTNAYVTASTCSPSRAALLSGRYQQRFGFEFNVGSRPGNGLDPSIITLADVFKAAGYATGIAGKWHLGLEPQFRPRRRGFKDFFGFLAGNHHYIHTGQCDPCSIESNGAPIQHREYLTAAIAKAAGKFIEAHRGSPFLLYIPFSAVHLPLEAPLEYRQRFSSGNEKRDTYYGMVSALDDAVGAILDTLASFELEENTIVVFLNDNGGRIDIEGPSNAPFRLGKFYLFEGGVRVPMFMRWPGVTSAQGSFDGMVSALDLFPTLCSAAGIELPSELGLDGVDLAPFLRGATERSPHERLYWRVGSNTAIRDERWKMIKSGESLWLFDLANDIGETRNLADENPRIVERLENDLLVWMGELQPPAWPPRSPTSAGRHLGITRISGTVDGMPYELYE